MTQSQPDRHPLRVLREHRGLTIEQMAELLGRDPRTVERWELGETEPHVGTQREVAAKLDVAVERLGFRRGRPTTTGQVALTTESSALQDPWSALTAHPVALTPMGAAPGYRRVLPVDRRKFGKSMGVTAVGFALEGFAAAPHRFVRALEVRSVSEDTLDGFEHNLNRLRDSYTHAGSLPPGGLQALLGSILANFQAISDLLQDHQPLAIRRRLVHLGAQYAAEVGFACYDLHADLDTARSYLHAAYTGAREVGDDSLAAYTLGLTARGVLARPVVGTTTPAAQEALRLLESASILARDAVPATKAWLLSQEAEAHARLGDLVATRRLLETGEALIERDSQDRPGWETFDASRFAKNAGGAYVRAGDTVQAEMWCEEALRRQGTGQQINRSVTLLDLAQVRVLQDRLDEAVGLGSEALAINPDSRVVAISARAAQLQEALAPYADVPAVREFDELLAAS